MVKAIRIYQHGPSNVLTPGNIELPPPQSDEVRLRHTAIGVNYIDTYYRSGLYTTTLPYTPGEEAVGIVEQIGSLVTEVNVGDRVTYATVSHDAYAEQRNIKSSKLIPIPTSLSNIQVASSLTRGLTAEYLLFRCYSIKPGQSILIHAITGGVGSITCQWAKALGAIVFGTVSSDSKIDKAKQFGCDEVINYSEQNFFEVIQDLTKGELLDVVYDGVGKTTLTDSLRCVKPRGLLVSFGNASGAPDMLNILDLARQGSIYLTRPRLHDYAEDRSELLSSAKRYFSALEKNIITPPETIALPLHEAYRAHEMLEDRTITQTPVLIP